MACSMASGGRFGTGGVSLNGSRECAENTAAACFRKGDV